MPVFAHASIYRGCRQINPGRKCGTVVARGTIKNTSCLNEENENSGIRFNEPATTLAIRHTMTNAAAALCMHIKVPSRLLRHLNHDGTFCCISFELSCCCYSLRRWGGFHWRDTRAAAPAAAPRLLSYCQNPAAHPPSRLAGALTHEVSGDRDPQW